MISKAEKHGIRQWVRRRPVITALAVALMRRATRKAAMAEIRKRFVWQAHAAIWARRLPAEADTWASFEGGVSF